MPHSPSTDARPLVSRDWPVAALLALSVALWFVLDRQQAGPDARLFLDGAGGVAWYLLGLLVLAWVAGRFSAPAVPYRQSLFLLALAAPFTLLMLRLQGAWMAEGPGKAISVLILLPGLVILAWGLRRASGRGQFLAVWLCLMTAVGFGWVTGLLNVQAGFWYAPEPGETDDLRAAWRHGERLLFEQPERIDRAVRRLAPGEPGRANAYFVGFAGFGGQKVFAEEIALASRVIGTRYGSTPRSLHLINDQRDLDAYPLATASGLRRALREIGARMDRSRDVLFLVLSSHGVEGAELVVQNGGLPLTQLSSRELADALREAGIRWKVVVISACFSGAFIDALRDDDSIILTAAAPDRTSFGCSAERDLTYFGEALFRDALPDAASLREAFTRAEAEIGAREAREGVEPSRPQAWFGSGIERYLAGALTEGAGAGRPPLDNIFR